MSRVVIVGAGFGGLACARALARKPVEVLLLDRHNYHLFTPLLYQVASSLLNPSDIAYPVRSALRSAPNVVFRLADVHALDPPGRAVTLAGGERLPYDWLVLATGATANFYGLSAVAAHAYTLNTLPDALELRDHVLLAFEAAARDPAEAARHLTFVIVGGGPTGVEYAGALAELIPLMRRDIPALRAAPVSLVLLEAQDRVLGTFAPSLSRHAQRRLERLGVRVVLGEALADVGDTGVTLRSGARIATGTLIWAAGALPQAPDLPFATTSPGRVVVGSDLRVEGQDRVFAIGDVGACPRGPGGPVLPMLSAPAIQGGRYVARAILTLEGGTAPRPFRYRDKGTMAVIGRNAAVAELGRLALTGFIGWLAWLVVHLYFLIGFRNRLAVLMRWGWNYLFYDRPIRCIVPGRDARRKMAYDVPFDRSRHR